MDQVVDVLVHPMILQTFGVGNSEHANQFTKTNATSMSSITNPSQRMLSEIPTGDPVTKQQQHTYIQHLECNAIFFDQNNVELIAYHGQSISFFLERHLAM